MTNTQPIVSFSGDHFFLSNFYRRGFFWEHPAFGRAFGLTAEHHFQAAKAYTKQDWLLVYSTKSPVEAKRLGRRIDRNHNWDEVRVDVMESILRAKFAPGRTELTLLLQTRDAELIEGNTWGDFFWGAMLDRHGKWDGENHLGKLLMKIREEIRSGQG